ncbi:hypothetical protein HMPREF9412_6407 [Paenibacillus sp. HGF5]|nr:hypothetical protein HMPREF9412_6407 [Paenibacillus sp. HGF5]
MALLSSYMTDKLLFMEESTLTGCPCFTKNKVLDYPPATLNNM